MCRQRDDIRFTKKGSIARISNILLNSIFLQYIDKSDLDCGGGGGAKWLTGEDTMGAGGLYFHQCLSFGLLGKKLHQSKLRMVKVN
jgi:hypothetical protein